MPVRQRQEVQALLRIGVGRSLALSRGDLPCVELREHGESQRQVRRGWSSYAPRTCASSGHDSLLE